MDLTVYYQVVGGFFVLLLLFVIVGYLYMKKWLRNKVRCVIIQPDKRVVMKYLAPDTEGLLVWRKGKEEVMRFQNYTELVTFTYIPVIREPIPTLFYHVDSPYPIDLMGLQAPIGLSSRSLGAAFDDKSLREFVEWESEGGLFGKAKLLLIVGAVNVTLIGLVGLALYWQGQKVLEMAGGQ